MYASILSVLLMGMVPVSEPALTAGTPGTHLSVGVPVPAQGAERLQTIARRLTASGVLIVDLQTAQPLYGRNIGRQAAMGSLAKLMTAVIIVEHHDLDEVVTIPKEATVLEGQHFLTAGNRFTVGDLLSAVLISSSNDAAYSLAIFHSGSIDAFADEMNTRARSLGLKDTSFANPVGFDDTDQWSTPRDIAWLATFAVRFPVIRTNMSTPESVITSLEGKKVSLSHTHTLLHQEDSAVVAGKTGTTKGAGECLVSIVKEGDREYLVVLLHSAARYADMQVVLRALSDLRV